MTHDNKILILIMISLIISPIYTQTVPGVWESHGPYTHAQTTTFFIDSAYQSRIYVAAADQGVFISETGGSSWHQLPAPLDTAVINRFIKIDQTLFAAGNGNLYLSSDGFTWAAANPPSAALPISNNTELHKNFIISFKDRLYTGILWGSGLYVSNDGGASWELVTTALDELTVMTFLTVGDTLFAATIEKGVFYTLDGSTWSSGSGIENKSFEHLIKSGDKIFAGGKNGLFSSFDGKSWNPATAPLDTSAITLLYKHAETLYAAVSGNNSGLFFSVDSAESWTGTLGGEKINGVLVSDGQLYAASESGVFTTLIDSIDWQEAQLQPDPGVIWDLAFNATDIYARSGQDLFHSSIGENDWYPTTEIWSKDRLHGLILNNSFILTYGSRVYRSLDKGLTWTTAYPPTNWGREKIVNVLKTNNGFLAAAGGIFHSLDGIVWAHLPSVLDQETLTSFISAGNIILAATAANGIFYSSDDGANWTQANGQLDNKYVHFIYPHENRVFSGTQQGLYYSDDNGLNWQIAIPALDTVAITSFCNGQNKLLAGTLGHGIWYSTDNGISWNQSNPPMSDTFVDKLYAHKSFIIAELRDNPIYFSRNNGVSWSSTDPTFGNQDLFDFSHVDDILFLSTWDNQRNKARIYRSIDTGSTWTALVKDLSDTSPLLAPLYLPNLNRLYTCGDGVSFQLFDLDKPIVTRFTPIDSSDIIADRDIQFFIEASDADSMIIAELSDYADADWQPYQQIADFTLSPTQGLKTIYARFKDFSANLSRPKTAQVELDNLPPVFTGTFMVTPSFSDSCVELEDLSWRLSFEDLDHAAAGQNWYLNPQCRDNPNDEIIVGMTVWPAGESSRSGFTNIATQPACDPVGPANNLIIYLHYRTYRNVIPGSALTNKGLDVQLLATDVAGNTSTFTALKYQDEPLSYFSLRVQLNGQHLGESDIIPGGTDAKAFHLVSVPYRPPENYRSDHLGNFGDYGPTGNWMFWSYQGDGVWANGNDTEIKDGSGYFILLRDSKPLKPILPTPTSVITTMKTTAGVWGEISGWQLRGNDWTLIGNPYRTRIELDQLKLKNRDIRLDQASTEFSIYAYTSNGWTTDDIALEPWGGLAIFLADSTDVIILANPDDPYTRPQNKLSQPLAGQLTELNENDWLVQIRAETAGSADFTNFLGVRSDALNDHDKYDWYEPPRIPGGVSVSFPHPEWKVATSYACDIREPADDGYTWLLQIMAEGGSSVTLNFDQRGEFPENFQMWLIDETTSLARDISIQSQIQVRIPEETNTKHYQIIVGTESYIANQTAGLTTVPSDFILDQNYPNPFNPVTVIRYALPIEGRVTLQIYDVLGRMVKTPEQNLYCEPGYYETLIDMTDVASGVYFYHLKVNGLKQFEDVQKMVLLR